MNRLGRYIKPCFAFLGMIVIILDSHTAMQGVLEGLEACFKIVIPSLFPMLVLSILLTSSMIGKKITFLMPLLKICGIPYGAESILITGLLGGYPVGAASIYRVYNAHRIDRQCANRMLAFCNNCGPGFIFGMGAAIFSDHKSPIALWAIHIASALMVGIILPNKCNSNILLNEIKPQKASEIMRTATSSIISICSWVIIFKTLLNFLTKWFLWFFPQAIQILIFGTSELTNGFIYLSTIPDENLKFIAASFFLAFGGLCVCMQTISEIHDLDIGSYMLGKSMQSLISIQISILYLTIIGKITENGSVYLTFFLIFGIFTFLTVKIYKKRVAFSENRIYNKRVTTVTR